MGFVAKTPIPYPPISYWNRGRNKQIWTEYFYYMGYDFYGLPNVAVFDDFFRVHPRNCQETKNVNKCGQQCRECSQRYKQTHPILTNITGRPIPPDFHVAKME